MNKRFCKKLISLFLVICLVIPTLTGCTLEEISGASIALIKVGFAQDTNGKNAAQLQMDIEAKFEYYEEILDKLYELGVLNNKDIYSDAIKGNKEYIIKALCEKRELDEDIGSAIAWVIDPQYVCRLYNDLSWISQYLDEKNLKDKGRHDYGEIIAYYSLSEQSDDIFNDYDVIDEGDTEGNANEEASKAQEEYWTKVILPAIGEGETVKADLNAIKYTLSVIDGINNNISSDLLSNTNNNFFKRIGNIFKGIRDAFLGNNSNDDHIYPFLVFPQGSTYTNIFTGNVGDVTTMANISSATVDQGIWNGGPVIPELNKDSVKKKLAKYAEAVGEDCFQELLTNIKLEDENENRGFSFKINKTSESFDEDDSEGVEEKFRAKAEKTCAILDKLMNYYAGKSANRSRHCTGHWFSDVKKDVHKSSLGDDAEVTYTMSYSAEFQCRTCKEIFLNIKDLSKTLIGNYNDTSPVQSIYRSASEIITNSGKTLCHYPYVAETEDMNGISSYESYSTLGEVLNKDKSSIKGKNFCAPSVDQAGSYNTNVNIPIRRFSYIGESGNYDLNYFREVLFNYDNQTKETKKELGENVIYKYTNRVEGEDGYLEDPNNLYLTTDYTKHVENLKYPKVLKSVAYGNSGQGAIDYNPANELGNDLIVTIANIPAFAIRLMEFNQYAAQNQAQNIQRAVEDGYKIITTKTRGDFAFDPRCQIVAIDYLDSTTNELHLTDTKNFFNLLTNHIYKAELDDYITPIDEIAQGDRDYITKKFIENELMNSYFGPCETGKLLLRGYEPLYYEPDEEVVPGNWYPIGRTMFLNNDNIITHWGERNDIITIKDFNAPIGYLASTATNRPASGAKGSPIYMRDICDKENIDLTGSDIPRVSIGAIRDGEEDEFEDYTESRTGDFKGTAFEAPDGEFISDTNGWWYKIATEPEENTEHYKQNENYWYPFGQYFWCLSDGPEGQKKYLYYFDEDGYLAEPDEDGKYDCLYNINEDQEYDDYKGNIIGNSGNKKGFYKAVNKTKEKKKEINRTQLITKIAEDVKNTFKSYTSKEYFNDPQEGSFYLRIEDKDIKNRKDCSSYASYTSVLLDKELGYTGKHMYDQNLYLWSTTTYAESSNFADTNYSVTALTGISDKSDIKNKIKPGDYLFYPARNAAASDYGHVVLVVGVSDTELTVYQWTSLACRGGPTKIPLTDINTNNPKGFCYPVSGRVAISMPSNGNDVNRVHEYTHIIRSKQ